MKPNIIWFTPWYMEYNNRKKTDIYIYINTNSS